MTNNKMTTAAPRRNVFITSRKHPRSLPAPALAMLASLALPLAAQAAPADVDPGIPTVQVTGANKAASANDKFTAPLLDTPKSVTVVPAEVISQTGAVSLTDALRTVPGITIGAGEGGNPVGDNLFIRGYNAQTDTYVDGIRDAGSQSREIFNLEQVEVVKGPNSAYGGRSSAGGGVNLVSKTAQAYDFNSISLGAGSDKYKRFTGDVNRNIGSNSAFRLNVMAHDADTPGRDVVGGSRWGVAPTVTFGLEGPSRAIFSLYHLTTHEIPDTGIPFNNPLTTGNLARNGDGRPWSVDRATFYGLANRDFRDTKSDVATVDLRHEFSKAAVLRNVTRYGRSQNDYVWTQPDDSKGNTALYGTVWRRINSRATETDTAANVTSLSGEWTAAGIKHSYNAGIEFDRESTDRAAYVFTPGTNNPLATNGTTCATTGAATLYNCTTLINPNPNDPWVYSRTLSPAQTSVETKTKSAYAFDTLEFTPQWLLNLGARFDDFESVLHTNANGATAATDATVDSTFWSYQAGLVFKPASNGSIYLSYATSATPPGNDGGDGLDALTVQIQNLQPQRSKNWELGTKWDVMPGGRLSLSGALFKSTMSNARVTAPDGTTQNVGRKEVKGVELGFSGKITPAWTVFGGATFLDAEIADNGFVNTGTTARPVYTASPFNGNRFPTTPKKSATLWTSYAINKDFTVGAGLSAMDRVYANVNNNKFAPGYTRFDAMASYNVNRDLSLQLNVQNLGDKLYFDKVSSPHYAGVAPGRSATLTANYKF
jgi:catecholate siderophore receptor